jgi:hypothetical protein
MTLSPTRSSTRRAAACYRRPDAAHTAASPVPFNSLHLFNALPLKRDLAWYGYAGLRAKIADPPIRFAS